MLDAVQQYPRIATSRWVYFLSIDHQLRKVSFADNDSDVAMLGRFQDTFSGDRKKLPFAFQSFGGLLLMSRIAIGWVELDRDYDHEYQAMNLRRNAHITRDDFMTTAFFDRRTSMPASTSTARYLFDKFGSGESDPACRVACVIYSELDRKVAAIWLLVALGVSAVIGFAAGAGGQSANLGFDVGTCALAVLSALQGILLLWQL